MYTVAMQLIIFLRNCLPLSERQKGLGSQLIALNLLFVLVMQLLTMTGLTIFFTLRGHHFGAGMGLLGAYMTLAGAWMLHTRGFSFRVVHLQQAANFISFAGLGYMLPANNITVLLWLIPVIANAAFLLPFRQGLFWIMALTIEAAVILYGFWLKGEAPTREGIYFLTAHFFGVVFSLTVLTWVMRYSQVYSVKREQDLPMRLSKES